MYHNHMIRFALAGNFLNIAIEVTTDIAQLVGQRNQRMRDYYMD
jgi:hypothetical protein